MRPDMLRCSKSRAQVPFVRSSGSIHPKSTWYRQYNVCVEDKSLACTTWLSDDSSTHCSLSVE
eukprot:4057861-Lingulodinium_polyedra.AAC.1